MPKKSARKVFYVRIPKQYVEVYRVVATSKADALKRVGGEGQQLSNENETDTGPAWAEESSEELQGYD